MGLAKSIKGLALLFCFYPVRSIIRCLPWGWALHIGALLGCLHALGVTDQLKCRIQDGMRAVWPDDLSETELKRLVRRNLLTRYKHLVDTFFYARLDETRIEQLVPQIEGRAYLDEARNKGQGVILLMSHFGSVGMLLGGLAMRGYRLHQLFTLTPPPAYRTWRWIERAVIRAKLHCWHNDKMVFAFWRPGQYLRDLYRTLRQGDILVLYGDGARGQQFTTVDFMGYPLSLPIGPFRLAAKAQAALIPAFVIRATDNRHRIVLESPIFIKDGDPASLCLGANQYALLLARYVRTYPDHWFTWARLQRVMGADGPVLELATGDVALPDFYTSETRQEV